MMGSNLPYTRHSFYLPASSTHKERLARERRHMPSSTSYPRLGAYQVPQLCNLDGISVIIFKRKTPPISSYVMMSQDTVKESHERRTLACKW